MYSLVGKSHHVYLLYDDQFSNICICCYNIDTLKDQLILDQITSSRSQVQRLLFYNDIYMSEEKH